MTFKKIIFVVFMILLIGIFPYCYISLLNLAIPHHGLKFEQGWTDDTLSTNYTNYGWMEQNFTEGWNMRWTMGLNDDEGGFLGNSSMIELTANFSGVLQGIEIQKSIGMINTTLYHYLIIEHKETSNDFPITFSAAVISANDVWHGIPWYHASTSWETIVFDLESIDSISNISIRITNDFNASYRGGVQKTFVRFIGLAAESHTWQMAQSNAVNAQILNDQGVLKVVGTISPDKSPGNNQTIVTAFRASGLTFNAATYNVMNVTVKTDASNVMVLVTVWTSPTQVYTVAFQSFFDKKWHNLLIDLSAFNLGTSQISTIELGWSSDSYKGSYEVDYGSVSFIKLV